MNEKLAKKFIKMQQEIINNLSPSSCDSQYPQSTIDASTAEGVKQHLKETCNKLLPEDSETTSFMLGYLIQEVACKNREISKAKSLLTYKLAEFNQHINDRENYIAELESRLTKGEVSILKSKTIPDWMD